MLQLTRAEVNAMEPKSTIVNFQEKAQTEDAVPAEVTQLIKSAAAMKQHLEIWEKAIDEKLTTAEQMLDKQLQQVQQVIAQFNRTLQSFAQQEWQQTIALVSAEAKQQTILLQETSTELKKTTQAVHARVERTTQQITKNITNTLQGLRVGELQQLVDDSITAVKTFAQTTTTKVENIVKWFHWKNLGLVFLLSLVVTLLVSLYIDDEWPWEAHQTVVKQRLAGQAVLSAWPQLTQLDKQQIMDDIG